MPFPYTFPIFFTGTILISGSDAGAGADFYKVLAQKAGTDMKIRGRQGQVELPHKEVSL